MAEVHPRSPGEYGRVAVLMGGDSAEREISLLSGNAVLRGLQAAGVDAFGVDAGQYILPELKDVVMDRVFIMLHGRKGEDGRIQAALELMEVPYTGSGVLASALAMDKVRCKKLWEADGLPTPAFALVDETSDFERIIADLGTVCVKPVHEGSSIGIARAETSGELQRAYADARKYDRLVMAEQWIEGKEFSVSIVGNRVLPVIELKPGEGFYDFHAKYESHETGYECPAALEETDRERLECMAWSAYQSVGCTGWGRVDVMQDTGGGFQLLEVNTIPGMTDHSLVPKSADAAGMTFSELVLEILASSLIDRSGG